MVSAGVCYGSKGQLHFVEEKANVNAEYYVNKIGETGTAWTTYTYITVKV